MIVERIPHSGAYAISEYVEDREGYSYLVTMQFYDYTKQEAIDLFCEALVEQGQTPTE